MRYEVSRAVRHETHDGRRALVVEFEPGVVENPSEDERFVLEHVLIPADKARRVERKREER